MENKLTERVMERLGVFGKETKEEKIRRRYNEYVNADESYKLVLFDRINVKEAEWEEKAEELMRRIPPLALLAHDVDQLSEQLNIATGEYFRTVFPDFDSSAARSIGMLVTNFMKGVKRDELVAYRESSNEKIVDGVIKWIERQGAEGRKVSKSSFVRDIKRNPAKLEQFENVLKHYVRFRWRLEMMKNGTYSNPLLDDAKTVDSPKLTLNIDKLEVLASR